MRAAGVGRRNAPDDAKCTSESLRTARRDNRRFGQPAWMDPRCKPSSL
jgi:hypothetical protein